LPTENDQRKPLARFDYQIGPKDHLTTRWGASRSFTTLSKDVKVGERMKMTGIAEVFNVYNHQQFTYNTLETSAAFGTRNGTAGPPRTAQLAFRVSF
jgi:hypothetical protein